MTDGLSLEERVAQYLERYPDAGAVQIAGALGVYPTAVRGILVEDTPDSELDSNSKTRERVRGSRSRPRSDRRRHHLTGGWSEADFADPDTNAYPPELLDREQWMGHLEKKPFAPWADRDAAAPCTKDAHAADTCAECDECDARFKWGYTPNYLDGEGIAMADDRPAPGRAGVPAAARRSVGLERRAPEYRNLPREASLRYDRRARPRDTDGRPGVEPRRPRRTPGGERPDPDHAAAAAGLEEDACRKAIAVPTTLEHCPWCGSDAVFENGARMCEDEGCDWPEEHHHVARRDGPRGRARAELDLEPTLD